MKASRVSDPVAVRLSFSPASRIILIERLGLDNYSPEALERSFSPASRIILIESPDSYYQFKSKGKFQSRKQDYFN